MVKQVTDIFLMKQITFLNYVICPLTFRDPFIRRRSRGKHLDPLLQRVDALVRCKGDTNKTFSVILPSSSGRPLILRCSAVVLCKVQVVLSCRMNQAQH